MRHRKKPLWDPVAAWDGWLVTGGRRVTPDEFSQMARNMMVIKEGNAQCAREDDDARRTPIGGMQYF